MERGMRGVGEIYCVLMRAAVAAAGMSGAFVRSGKRGCSPAWPLASVQAGQLTIVLGQGLDDLVFERAQGAQLRHSNLSGGRGHRLGG